MIRIICVGKLKEGYWKEAQAEYYKRIQKYTNLSIIEVPDCMIDEEKIALEREKEEILRHLTGKEYLITLEIEGKMLSSMEFSQKLDQIFLSHSDITFLIGGSYGIHPDLKERAQFHLSFSSMTFPHQLFRILLLEQIFRSYKILNHEKYHK